MAQQQFEAIAWPDDMKPSLSPIHFTNEIEADVPVDTIWMLVTRPEYWPRFYPGVKSVTLVGGGDTLSLSKHFRTNLAGQDVEPVVGEFEPKTRIAWGGTIDNSGGSKAYHAWIFTPTANGCHIWTEETMQGPLWIDLAKEAPDRFWQAHEQLLHDLVRVAREIETGASA